MRGFYYAQLWRDPYPTDADDDREAEIADHRRDADDDQPRNLPQEKQQPTKQNE